MQKKTSHRSDRVAEALLHELAMLLLKEVADPRIKGVTLSDVKLSPDLSFAKVYFTVLDESAIAKVTKALNHTVSFLRRRIAQTMQLRIVPALYFVYDDTLRNALHLTELLNSIPLADENKKE